MGPVRGPRCSWAACLALAAGAAGCPGADVKSVAGALELQPGVVDLGVLPLGQATTRTVALTNVGNAGLRWRAATSDDALSLSTTAATLGSGETRPLALTVQPMVAGPLVATVTIDTDSAATPQRILVVTASVAPEALQVTPDPVAFGSVRVGHTRTTVLRITSHNPEPVAFTATLEGSTPGFSALLPTRALTLASGASAELPVTFAPDAPGAARARLLVEGACLGCQRIVQLSGEGVPASLVCTPGALAFGAVNVGSAVSRRLSCSNISSEAIVLQSAVVDPEVGPFFADPPVLPLTLAAGAELGLSVTFQPQDAVQRSAQLTWEVLEGDVGLTQTSVALSGQGGGPDVRVSTTLLYFGGAVVGGAPQLRSLTVLNAGTAPLTLTGAQLALQDAGFALGSTLPARLEPGAQAELHLLFTPAALGDTQALLHILSDDADQPRLDVVLEGVGLPAGHCTARLSPEAASFGLVRVGSQLSADVTLQAGTDAACAWFDPRLAGDPSFSFEAAPPRSGVLGPGQTRSFRIRYAPTAPSSEDGHQAVFRVDVPHDALGALEAPLQGVAAESDLVVFPSAVAFDTRPVGSSQERTVHVHNTGEQPHTLADVSVLGAAAGLQVLAPPLPFNLRPGEATQVRLRWTPTEPGTLQAQVTLRSNLLPAAVRVPVTGQAVTTDCARVTGEICLPAGLGPAMGAEVTVVGADGQRTTSRVDEGGRFLSACLAPGLARVSVRRGHYTAETALTVSAGRTSALPVATCLAPPEPSRVAVVLGAFDHVEDVLASVGISHVSVPGVTNTAQVLLDPDLADRVDLLFINCGAHDARDPEVAENLRRFVFAGGSVYVSDLAYDLVEAAFPEALALAGDDATQDAAEVGRVLEFSAQLLAPELLLGLSQGRLPVALDGDYAVVEAAGPGAEVLAVGPTTGLGQGLAPVVIRYRPGATTGAVLYTTLHDSAAVADPLVRRMLALLALSL